MAAHARALAGDYAANMQLARMVVRAEDDGHEVVALVDEADWRTAHAMVGRDEADVIIGADAVATIVDTGPDVPARRHRPQPIER